MIARFVRRAMVWLVQVRARLPGAYRNDRIVVIAGQGDLPARVANGAKNNGLDVHIFALEHADRFEGFPTISISLDQPTEILKKFFKSRAKSVCLIGGVTLTDEMRHRWKGVAEKSTRPDRVEKNEDAQNTGDSALSHLLAEFCDKMNITLRDASEFLPSALLETERMGPEHQINPSLLNRCVNAAIRLGELDIGQAAVGFGRRVVAVEGAEGTDALLERVAAMRDEGIIDPTSDGLLVKWPKPGQRLDVDLPAIGPKTVELCANAQIKTIVVKKNHCLVAQRDETEKAAIAYDVAIVTLESAPKADD